MWKKSGPGISPKSLTCPWGGHLELPAKRGSADFRENSLYVGRSNIPCHPQDANEWATRKVQNWPLWFQIDHMCSKIYSASARQATFDFGDKNRQMQSSDVVSCRQLTSLNFRSFPGRHEGSLKCRHMSSHGSWKCRQVSSLESLKGLHVSSLGSSRGLHHVVTHGRQSSLSSLQSSLSSADSHQ
jgi:hypothetical protein